MGHSNAGAGDSSNLSYVESLYIEYRKSPELVSPDWRDYFQQLDEAQANSDGSGDGRSLFHPQQVGDRGLVTPVQLDYAILQERVDRLIRNYRSMGHYAADIDPLENESTAGAREELDALARDRARADRSAEADRRLEELKKSMGK